MPSPEHIKNLLRGVIDPELGADIVELGMAQDVRVDPGGVVTVRIALTTAGYPLRAQIQKDVRARIASLPGVAKVKIDWTELTQEQKATAMARARFNKAQNAPDTEIPATTKVILIASGKGGVGKSSITANVAAGLAQRGFTVGVLDADIWGHSIPRMLGVTGRLGGTVNAEGTKKITPHERPLGTGLLKVVSMGFLVEHEETALMWRGLVLNRAVQQFLQDVQWGELDYLVVDMPPGTGDVQMGVARLLPRSEMIIVTSPSKVAQTVAARVANMGRNCYLRIAGVIENMTAFVDDRGVPHAVFGTGGGTELATTVGVPLLGQVPIDRALADGADNGSPVILGTGPAADALNAIVELIVAEAVPPIAMAGCSARMLDAAAAALDRLDS